MTPATTADAGFGRPGAIAMGRRVAAAPARAPFWAAVLLLGSYLGPSEMTIKLGVAMTTLRLALLVMLVWGAVVMARRLAAGTYVPVMSDGIVLLLVFWMELSLFATTGTEGLASALGVRPVEFLSAYLAGRFLFSTREGLDAFVQVLLVLVGLLVLLGLLDMAAGENILGRLAKQFFVPDRTVLYVTQYRMGLPRARGSFEHAILFGTFFSVCAPLLYYLSRGALTWVAALGLCLCGIVLALSSAPMLSFFIFATLATFDRILNRAPWRWSALLVMVVYVVLVTLFFVEDPLRTMVESFTLEPQTGIYRFLIWEWVAYNLQPTPWFGIGGKDWVRLSGMVSSVDALWLGQALNAGYVGVALLALSIVGAFFVWPRSAAILRHEPWIDTGRKAVSIALVQMVFVSFTVHYWGTCWAFFALLIGIQAGLSEARRLDVSAAARKGSFPVRPRGLVPIP
ncbi:O-antigen ligase family protein, partial [Methylobacterium trifolii]